MIYINQGELNEAAAVASRNKTLTGNVTYLWSMQHKLSGRRYRFIPFRILPATTYPPGYDLFCITIDDSIPESLTGNTICGDCNVHLIPGEYYLKIYEQLSTTNLNPQLSYDVVYETIVNVVGTNQNNPVTYSGTSDGDVFIIYNADND
jgi:hypothetical protein